jgi:hypothetical protein
MSQADIWGKAAEVARAVEVTSDPKQREMLIHLRTLWTNLANESPFLGDKLAEQITALSIVHADLMQAATNKVTSNPPSIHPEVTSPGRGRPGLPFDQPATGD